MVKVAFGQESYTVAEGYTVDVVVTLDQAPGRTVVIPVTKANLGGAEDGDYSGVPDSVTFQASDTRKEFSFTATSDAVDEDVESVRLGFGTLPAGVTAGSPSVTTVSIINVGEAPDTTDRPGGPPAVLPGVLADPDQHHPGLVHRGDRRRVQAGIPQGRRDRLEQGRRRLRPSTQHVGFPQRHRRGGRAELRDPVPLPAELQGQRRSEGRRQPLSLRLLQRRRRHHGADRGVRPGGAGHQPAGLHRTERRAAPP